MLKTAQLRVTQQRLDILKILLGAKTPLNREQITEMLGKNGPNKVTIYRILERLFNKGLVHKAFVGDRTWHYELAHNCTVDQCHPHFICNNCGKVTCLYDIHFPLVEGLGENFIFQRQKIIIEGIGPECSAGFFKT